MARVSGLFVAEASMKPMVSKDAVDLVAGKGISGDRYAEGLGTYQPFKEPGRQLTLISADTIEELTVGKLHAPSVANLRRNVVLRGISAAELESYIGMEVRLGKECRVFVHRLCVPCKYNMRLNKCAIDMEEYLWQATGVNCEVLAGGELRIGDSVEAVPGSRDPGRIEHGKPPEFFMRPSQRPKQGKQGNAGDEELPESVRRAYEAVMNNTVPSQEEDEQQFSGDEHQSSGDQPLASEPQTFRTGKSWGGYVAAVLALIVLMLAVLLRGVEL